MLELFHRLSGFLLRLQLTIWLVLAASGVAFVVSVLRSDASQDLPLVSLVVGLWAALLIAVAHCFAKLPRAPNPGAGLFSRWGQRLKLGLLWLLGLGTILTLGLMIVISTRAIGLLLD